MFTSELLSVIDEYVEGVISLEQLEDWLVPRLPSLFRLPLTEPDATDLAAAVELGLAEMSNQAKTEDEFRNMLKALLGELTSVRAAYPSDKVTVSESSNQTLVMPAVQRVSAEFVGNRLFS